MRGLDESVQTEKTDMNYMVKLTHYLGEDSRI